MFLNIAHHFNFKRNDLLLYFGLKVFCFSIQFYNPDTSLLKTFALSITLWYFYKIISFIDASIDFNDIFWAGRKFRLGNLSLVVLYSNKGRLNRIEILCKSGTLFLVDFVALIKNMPGPGGFEPWCFGNGLVLPFGQVVNFICCLFLPEDKFDLKSLWHNLQL